MQECEKRLDEYKCNRQICTLNGPLCDILRINIHYQIVRKGWTVNSHSK